MPVEAAQPKRPTGQGGHGLEGSDHGSPEKPRGESEAPSWAIRRGLWTARLLRPQPGSGLPRPRTEAPALRGFRDQEVLQGLLTFSQSQSRDTEMSSLPLPGLPKARCELMLGSRGNVPMNSASYPISGKRILPHLCCRVVSRCQSKAL